MYFIHSLLLFIFSFSVISAELPEFPKAWLEVEGNELVFYKPETDSFVRGVKLPLELVAGKVITLNAEVKANSFKAPLEVWLGPKMALSIKTPTTTRNEYARGIGDGTFDWKPITLKVPIPPQAESVLLQFGFQKSSGELRFRNLKITLEDTAAFDLGTYGNMDYVDQTAGDGKGGWSDQGPENDAAKFNRRPLYYGEVPFFLTRSSGNTILVFRSHHFSDGLTEKVIDAKNVSGKYLYLLHTMCWGGGTNDQNVGFLELTGNNGKTQIFDIVSGNDVADWWKPRNIPNGRVVTTWKRGDGDPVGIYLSKFELEPDLGQLNKITFRSVNGKPLWIVLGMTVSMIDFAMPVPQVYEVKTGKDFKELPRPKETGILPGSALDRSKLLPCEPAGNQGRVIVNPNGHLAFEKNPLEPVFFLASCEGSDTWAGRGRITSPQLNSKEKIERYVEQLKIHGYNMVRCHFLDAYLSENWQGEGIIDPQRLDLFYYFVAKLKENGLYINLDAQTSWIGYNRGQRWSKEGRKFPTSKQSINWDEAVKRNWSDGVHQIITSVNPYTGLKMIDDPVLAIIVCFNEQEGYSKFSDWTPLQARWHDFLKKRYSDMNALKKAWQQHKVNATDFEQLPVFTPGDLYQQTPYGADVQRFIAETGKDMIDFYIKELRSMGYKGIISQWNFGQDLRDSVYRQSIDMVTMNNYHNHPSRYNERGSVVSQTSSIGIKGLPMQAFIRNKLYHKPFGITEHGHAFWSHYRYEQSFMINAYGAFQGFDLITFFAQPISITPVGRIQPFNGSHDPITYTQEFLAFFMGRRGDIRSASSTARVNIPEKIISEQNLYSSRISEKLSLLGLCTGFAIDLNQRYPLHKSDLEIPFDTGLNTTELVNQLKQKGILPPDNQTNPDRGIYQTSTGEILLNAPKALMTVNTPRLQGLAAKAGTKADFSNFKVHSMSVDANIALVSIDSAKAIGSSSRLIMICATDALNSNMKFEDKERRILIDSGTNPTIIQVGKFSVSLKHPQATRAKVYPLHINGARMPELKTVIVGDELKIEFDTATLPEGPALFYEIIFK